VAELHSEIHAELSKPTLLQHVKHKATSELGQLLDKGHMTYAAKKTYDTLPQTLQTTLPKPLQEKFASVAAPAFVSLLERMTKSAALLPSVMGAARALPGAAKSVALGASEAAMHKNEVAGLGVLAVPGLDTLQASARARFAGDKSHDAVEKRHLLGEGAHAALDVGGLGLLAAPAAARLKHAGVGVGAGMTASQYSGPLSLGSFKMVSGIPGFNNPELAAKPTKQASAFFTEVTKLLKLGGMNTATGAMHAAGKLHATQSVGAPKTTAPAGPSIAEVSKPQGFGVPISGAKKNML
jgi:hypothetical protein